MSESTDAADHPTTARELLAHRDYMLFWSTRVASTLGVQIQSVALGWQMYAVARETMDVKYKGPDIAISFNPAFLMDPLKALTADEVFLDLTDDTSPGVMRSTISFVYVLMPIRVS